MNLWEIICVTCGLSFVVVLLATLAICWVKDIKGGKEKRHE